MGVDTYTARLRKRTVGTDIPDELEIKGRGVEEYRPKKPRDWLREYLRKT